MTNMIDLDAPDILVCLISRIAPGPRTLTEASAPGLHKEGAAYILRTIAEQWVPSADQSIEMTARWVALRKRVDEVRDLVAAAAFAEVAPSVDVLAAGILAVLDRPEGT